MKTIQIAVCAALSVVWTGVADAKEKLRDTIWKGMLTITTITTSSGVTVNCQDFEGRGQAFQTCMIPDQVHFINKKTGSYQWRACRNEFLADREEWRPWYCYSGASFYYHQPTRSTYQLVVHQNYYTENQGYLKFEERGSIRNGKMTGTGVLTEWSIGTDPSDPNQRPSFSSYDYEVTRTLMDNPF